MPATRTVLLWIIAFVLIWAYISPITAVLLGAGHLALYVGGWIVVARLLGVLK